MHYVIHIYVYEYMYVYFVISILKYCINVFFVFEAGEVAPSSNSFAVLSAHESDDDSMYNHFFTVKQVKQLFICDCYIDCLLLCIKFSQVH